MLQYNWFLWHWFVLLSKEIQFFFWGFPFLTLPRSSHVQSHQFFPWNLYFFFFFFFFVFSSSYFFFFFFFLFFLLLLLLFLLISFPHQLMVFHGSLSDSKFPQVSRTLLSILADYYYYYYYCYYPSLLYITQSYQCILEYYYSIILLLYYHICYIYDYTIIYQILCILICWNVYVNIKYFV